MKRIALTMMAALFAGACSLSPMIDSDIIDYNNAVSDAGNRLLLLNVLRARDRAPLLFSAVQLVHGSLQAGASSNLSVPFGNGPLKNPNSWGLSLSTQVAPTFDVSSLDTQDFTRGILSPIDPAVVKYFLDRGEVDPKIILLLFFAEIQDSGGNAIRIDPESPLDIQSALNDLATGKVRGNSRIIANAYTELTPVGGELAKKDLTSLKDIASIDQTKYRLLADKDDKDVFRLYAVSATQKVAFCLRIDAEAGTRFIALGNVFNAETAAVSQDDPRCTKDEIKVGPHNEEHRDGRRLYQKVITRSVEGIVQFLGSVLRYEDEHGGEPVTFDHFIKAANAGEPTPDAFGTNTSDIFFRLNRGSTNAMFGVDYLGKHYSVPRADGGSTVKDHTLEVLALVSKLLDMNKSAKDLPVTQSVQIVP